LADYEKMYHMLNNAITDAIIKLQDAQLQAEQVYMDGKDAEIVPLRPVDKKEE